MSKKIEYLTNCQNAVEHLRVDAESGKILIYDIPNFPPGVIPAGYLNKCASVAVAITGSGNFDYLVAMPERPDKSPTSGSAKVIDIDPAVFCLQKDSLEMFPTGAKFNHQSFPFRTTPAPGTEKLSVEDTLSQFRQNLVTGYQPISGSPEPYLHAISHSVAKLNSLIGQQISSWDSASKSSARPEVAVEPPRSYPATPTSTPPGTGSKPDV
jgi:hypothetical protein